MINCTYCGSEYVLVNTEGEELVYNCLKYNSDTSPLKHNANRCSGHIAFSNDYKYCESYFLPFKKYFLVGNFNGGDGTYLSNHEGKYIINIDFVPILENTTNEEVEQLCQKMINLQMFS